MEHQAFQRSAVSRPPPTKTQLTVPKKTRSASPDDELPVIGGGARSELVRKPSTMFKGKGLQMPTLAAGSGGESSASGSTRIPLPDIPRKHTPAAIAIPQQRAASQEPKVAASALDGGPSSSAPAATTMMLPQQMPSSSPRMNFVVEIPVSSQGSSPVAPLPRKRAGSLSQHNDEGAKRRREDGAQDDDADWVPSDTDSVLRAGPASQKGKKPRSGAAKGAGASSFSKKAGADTFSRPTSALSDFLATDLAKAERHKNLLAEIDADLAKSRTLPTKKVIPTRADKLKECPFCSLPWPEKASRRLVDRAQPLLDNFHKNAKISKTDKMSMCSLHNFEAVVLPEGVEKDWPTEKNVDWPGLEAAFFEGGKEGRQAWIMKQMCSRVRDPSSSKWYRNLKEAIDRDGIRSLTSAQGLFGTMVDEQVGYFGELGASKMLDWLRRAFQDMQIPKANNPYPDEDLRLDKPERKALLHPLNSGSFLTRCLVPELATCLIKDRDKVSFEEANEIRAKSSTYGSATFPLLAEEDVGQFLEFDLEKDAQSPARTPSASASNTPSRRSPRKTTSAMDSPLAARVSGRPTRQGRKSMGDVSQSQDSSTSARPRPRPLAAGGKGSDGDEDTIPSSLGSSFQPGGGGPRSFRRVASQTSMYSIYDSDDDTSLPSGSQQPLPSASQAPPKASRAMELGRSGMLMTKTLTLSSDTSDASTSPPPSQPPPASQRPQARLAQPKAVKGKATGKSAVAKYSGYSDSDDEPVPSPSSKFVPLTQQTLPKAAAASTAPPKGKGTAAAALPAESGSPAMTPPGAATAKVSDDSDDEASLPPSSQLPPARKPGPPPASSQPPPQPPSQVPPASEPTSSGTVKAAAKPKARARPGSPIPAPVGKKAKSKAAAASSGKEGAQSEEEEEEEGDESLPNIMPTRPAAGAKKARSRASEGPTSSRRSGGGKGRKASGQSSKASASASASAPPPPATESADEPAPEPVVPLSQDSIDAVLDKSLQQGRIAEDDRTADLRRAQTGQSKSVFMDADAAGPGGAPVIVRQEHPMRRMLQAGTPTGFLTHPRMESSVWSTQSQQQQQTYDTGSGSGPSQFSAVLDSAMSMGQSIIQSFSNNAAGQAEAMHAGQGLMDPPYTQSVVTTSPAFNHARPPMEVPMSFGIQSGGSGVAMYTSSYLPVSHPQEQALQPPHGRPDSPVYRQRRDSARLDAYEAPFGNTYNSVGMAAQTHQQYQNGGGSGSYLRHGWNGGGDGGGGHAQVQPSYSMRAVSGGLAYQSYQPAAHAGVQPQKQHQTSHVAHEGYRHSHGAGRPPSVSRHSSGSGSGGGAHVRASKESFESERSMGGGDGGAGRRATDEPFQVTAALGSILIPPSMQNLNGSSSSLSALSASRGVSSAGRAGSGPQYAHYGGRYNS